MSLLRGEIGMAHGSSSNMRQINLNLPERDLDLLDELVRAELYPNRAEAIRLAIKDLINLHLQRK